MIAAWRGQLPMSGEREPRPSDWFEARRYRSRRQALSAYEGTRDLIVEDALEVSVFRLTLHEVSYVAVVGEEPLGPEALRKIEERLARGDRMLLPDEVVAELRRRRRAFRSTGANFMERRSGEL